MRRIFSFRRYGRAVAAFLVATIATVGCQFTRMLPESAAVQEEDRTRVWRDVQSSEATYTGPPAVSYSVVPFLVFAVPYGLDIVLVSNHPEWEMHEYARVRTPEGPVWLAKDTRAENGDQLLVTSSDLLFEEMPEIPLAAKRRPVRVRDRSEGNRLDLEVRYRNFDGENVRVTYRGRKPIPARRRNGSTMGHSRNEALAVLDLSHRSFGNRASIAIGGKHYRIRRILGLKPLQLAIRQVQGGIGAATYQYSGGDGRITRHRRSEREDSSVRWMIDGGEDEVVVRQKSALRTLVYRFRRTESGAEELFEVRVEFWNADEPIFRLRFAPALPDLRRPFEDVTRSRWVADVGGEKGHAEGVVLARSSDRAAELGIFGTEPRWVANRCTFSNLEYGNGRETQVRTVVEPCEGTSKSLNRGE